MSTQPDEELETEDEIIYWDYLEEAERVKKERESVIFKYFRGMLIGIIIMLLALIGILPTYAFFFGAFITIIAFFVGLVMVIIHTKKIMDNAGRSRPGFTEFYKLFPKHYWPYATVTGKKHEKFLSILGGVEMINEIQTQKRQQSLEIADDLLAEAEDAYEEGKDFEIVLNLCERAIQVAPDNSETYVLQGTVYEDLGKWDDAIIAYRNALKYNPKLEDAEKGILDVEEKRKHG
jgi:tetratricopeptide (TPR) repeat protein